MSLGQNGNGAEPDQEAPIIYTTDEEGVEHQFQMLDMIEVEGQAYALLLYIDPEAEESAEESEDDEDDVDELVVMRITKEGDEQVFESIEDEAEFDRVVDYVSEYLEAGNPVGITLEDLPGTDDEE